MIEIHFNDQDFCKKMVEVFESSFPVVLFEFRNVFGLLATNSLLGVEALNKTKNRLSGKFYGSFSGDLNRFSELIDDEKINNLELLNNFVGSFIRVPVKAINKFNPVVNNGLHQTLIEDLPVRKKIAEFETEYLKIKKTSDFFAFNFQAPLCTSANESGDPNGGITNKEIALEFGKIKGIPLFVHTDLISDGLGSYPIFSLLDDKITTHRDGAETQNVLKKIQKYLSKDQTNR